MRRVLVMCIALWALTGCLGMGIEQVIGPAISLIGEAVDAMAQQAPVYVDPTIPGGSGIRDYSRPSLVIQGGQVQQTYPGTYIPDQRRGGWVVEPGQTGINQPYQQGGLYGQQNQGIGETDGED